MRTARICNICNHTKTEHVPYQKQDSLRDHCKTCHKERGRRARQFCQHELQDKITEQEELEYKKINWWN